MTDRLGAPDDFEVFVVGQLESVRADLLAIASGLKESQEYQIELMIELKQLLEQVLGTDRSHPSHRAAGLFGHTRFKSAQANVVSMFTDED